MEPKRGAVYYSACEEVIVCGDIQSFASHAHFQRVHSAAAGPLPTAEQNG